MQQAQAAGSDELSAKFSRLGWLDVLYGGLVVPVTVPTVCVLSRVTEAACRGGTIQGRKRFDNKVDGRKVRIVSLSGLFSRPWQLI